MKQFRDNTPGVYSAGDLAVFFDLLPYDDPDGKAKETLYELNSDAIHDRAVDAWGERTEARWDPCEGWLDKDGKPVDFYEDLLFEKLEQDIEAELFRAWELSVMSTVTRLFDEIDMDYEQGEIVHKSIFYTEPWHEKVYHIYPKTSWKHSADLLADLVYYNIESGLEAMRDEGYPSYKQFVIGEMFQLRLHLGERNVDDIFSGYLNHYLYSW